MKWGIFYENIYLKGGRHEKGKIYLESFSDGFRFSNSCAWSGGLQRREQATDGRAAGTTNGGRNALRTPGLETEKCFRPYVFSIADPGVVFRELADVITGSSHDIHCPCGLREDKTGSTSAPGPKVVTADIQAGIENYIEEQTRLNEGYYNLPFRDRDLRPKLVRVHTEYLSRT